MRICFALAGLHVVQRGAEVAFLAVATNLARAGHDVTLIGGGPPLPDRPYRYLQASRIARERFERFPHLPALRSDTMWEEASFVPGLLRRYRPADYDTTVTCSYPWTSWALRRPTLGGKRPRHVFVTQNGDWPARSNDAEYRLFDCDGLVCINPDYLATNQDRYRSVLIPNGVDTRRFTPGPADRARFGIPDGVPVVLMVSAMIASKNVAEGIKAVGRVADAQLVVAGDGPLRAELQALADEHLPGRYRPILVASEDMPALYRSADVFLHLSKDESFGNVYVEALACATPIVAHDLPRTRWILGDEGFLVPPDADITDSLRYALAEGAGRRAAMVARAASFEWREIAGRYLEFFEDVVIRSSV